MRTALCPAADSPPTPTAGCHASRGSSSRYESCLARSAAAFSNRSRTCIGTGTLISSANTSIWPILRPSPTGSCRCVSASGSSYAKRLFAGPEAVLAYLSRYPHRVAVSNSRLEAMDDRGVTFRWKDCREHGRTRYKTMSLQHEEFMRRFLLHMPPSGFHRIRHYGLLANANRKHDIPAVREILHQPAPTRAAESGDGTAGRDCHRPPSSAGTAARRCSLSRPWRALSTSAVLRARRSQHDRHRVNQRKVSRQIPIAPRLH